MDDTKWKDPRVGPLIRFELCGEPIRSGPITDYYNRRIALPIPCNLPAGHTGPHGFMKYAEIEYEADD
jgi:hypothetical protein